MKKLSILVAVSALLCAAPVSVNWSHEKGVALSSDNAEARVGRPATPASVAGVARRTTRRAVVTAPVRRY